MQLTTVSDLINSLTTHVDVGLAMTLQDAIRLSIQKKGLKHEDALTAGNLEKIRQSVYDLNDPSREEPQADPMLTLLNAMMSSFNGQGGSTIDKALIYIENLQRQASPTA